MGCDGAVQAPFVQTSLLPQQLPPHIEAVAQQLAELPVPTHVSSGRQQSFAPHADPRVPGPQQISRAEVQVSPDAQQFVPHAVIGGLQHWPPEQVPGGGQQPADGPQLVLSAPQQAESFTQLGVADGQQMVLPWQVSPAPVAQQSVWVAVPIRHVGVPPGQQNPLSGGPHT